MQKSAVAKQAGTGDGDIADELTSRLIASAPEIAKKLAGEFGRAAGSVQPDAWFDGDDVLLTEHAMTICGVTTDQAIRHRIDRAAEKGRPIARQKGIRYLISRARLFDDIKQNDGDEAFLKAKTREKNSL